MKKERSKIDNTRHPRLVNITNPTVFSLVFLATQPGELVRDNNIQLSSSFHNLFPFLCGYIVSNFSTVSPVVHHQQLKFFGIVHNKFLETIRKIVAGLLIRAISNVGHQGTSLELSTYSGINTLGPPPVLLYHATKKQLENALRQIIIWYLLDI